MRINITGSLTDHLKDKKVYTRGLLWPPSGPLSPGEALDAGHTDARRQVVYLRYADKYFGLLASRLRGVYQPVISTPNPFLGPHPHPLASICAYGAPQHHDHQISAVC